MALAPGGVHQQRSDPGVCLHADRPLAAVLKQCRTYRPPVGPPIDCEAAQEENRKSDRPLCGSVAGPPVPLLLLRRAPRDGMLSAISMERCPRSRGIRTGIAVPSLPPVVAGSMGSRAGDGVGRAFGDIDWRLGHIRPMAGSPIRTRCCRSSASCPGERHPRPREALRSHRLTAGPDPDNGARSGSPAASRAPPGSRGPRLRGPRGQ